MSRTENDLHWMNIALDLARRGLGSVEPNPMVGCVIVRDEKIIASGYHERFGGPHAEVNALRNARESVAGATVYVTLEPCSHFGKTPPCVDALIDARVGRVVIGTLDPNPQVNGQGVKRLSNAQIETTVGICEEAARDLIKPFTTLVTQGRPWIIAKWAMSLDGKIATKTGESQWISNTASREHAHRTRGRVDAIMVGIGTVEADDPLLTARPPGPRIATRVIVDAAGRLSPATKIVQTARDIPTIVAVGKSIPDETKSRLIDLGVEVWESAMAGDNYNDMLRELMSELGNRRMTNVLVEGGGRLLGLLNQERLIDEAHVYIAPKLIGGTAAPSPLGDPGFSVLADCQHLQLRETMPLDSDVFIRASR